MICVISTLFVINGKKKLAPSSDILNDVITATRLTHGTAIYVAMATTLLKMFKGRQKCILTVVA